MTVARVWRGVVPAGKAKAYTRYLEATGVPDCLATKGNRGVYVLTRPAGEDVEVLFLSFWDSLASIRRFAGQAPELARYYPEDREFLRYLEPYVRHYATKAYTTRPKDGARKPTARSAPTRAKPSPVRRTKR